MEEANRDATIRAAVSVSSSCISCPGRHQHLPMLQITTLTAKPTGVRIVAPLAQAKIQLPVLFTLLHSTPFSLCACLSWYCTFVWRQLANSKHHSRC